MAYDIVIKNGTVVDGSGRPAYRADVAIQDDRIAAVGRVNERAERTLDAEGHVVTPGFIDIHTHLDAQITWDPIVTSSCWHGVTSIVMGNCGVTFAPCRAQDREYLAHLMESVEDIPAKSILAGMSWTWETYGEYLRALDRLPKGVNVGGLVGHCAVRYYAMGEESLENRPASPEAIERMRAAVAEAIAAGALGFSTSRTPLHRTPAGQPVPGTYAEVDELMGICNTLGEQQRGVVEAATGINGTDPETVREKLRTEIDWMIEVGLATGRPVTFGLAQGREALDAYARVLERVEAGVGRGAVLKPQSTARGIGVLFGFVNRTPFDRAPSWRALRGKPLAEKVAMLHDADYRASMVREAVDNPPPLDCSQLFLLSHDEVRYDHRPADSLQTHAERLGVSTPEAFILLSLEQEGRALFNYPFLNPEFEAVEAMLAHPHVVIGLGDSGAHCGQIMDASLPTYYLTYWVRERQRFALEQAIYKLTAEPAQLYALQDRGTLRPGAYADVNVFDFEKLRLRPPAFVHDFPTGSGRYIQQSSGYAYTLVNGQVFMEGLEHTGTMAGSVLRSG
jgi:N-acyl-D-amino-acid deacylase